MASANVPWQLPRLPLRPETHVLRRFFLMENRIFLVVRGARLVVFWKYLVVFFTILVDFRRIHVVSGAGLVDFLQNLVEFRENHRGFYVPLLVLSGYTVENVGESVFA